MWALVLFSIIKDVEYIHIKYVMVIIYLTSVSSLRG